MSIIYSSEDLETLYKMEGETLRGIIYEPEDSGDLDLVFDHYVINISEGGVVSVEERKEHP